MAKKESLNALQVQDRVNKLYLTNDESAAGITWAEAFDFLENIPSDNMQSANSMTSYLTFEEVGKEYNMFAKGIEMIRFKDDKEDTEVVRLIDRNGEEWLCGAKVLVGKVKQLKTLPAMIRIIYKGEEKSPNIKGGKYKNLEVLLPAIKIDDLPF